MDKKVVIISGAHNSGKTTFIEKVVNILKKEGFKVAYIKHDPKGKAKTDTEGKDSYKIYQAGADEVIIASPFKITHYKRMEDYSLKQLINMIDSDIDIIIVEGFKSFIGFKKFEVIRKEEGRDLINEKENLTGIITDYYDFNLKFDINKPQDFVDYLKDFIKEGK